MFWNEPSALVDPDEHVHRSELANLRVVLNLLCVLDDDEILDAICTTFPIRRFPSLSQCFGTTKATRSRTRKSASCLRGLPI